MSPAWGALLGALLGTGAALALAGLPVWRRVDLDARLAPHLLDRPRASRLLEPLAAAPGGRRPGSRGAGPLRPLARWWSRRGPSSAALAHRLALAGSTSTVEQHRADQLLAGTAGALAGVLVALLALSRGASAAAAALVPVGALAGVLVRDQLLTRAVRRREERLLVELPTVAELLALSVGAGEGAVGALDRVARTCRGELAAELRRVLADARGGVPLVTALERLGARTGAAPVARFVQGVAVAVQRGTPLAEVLAAQAQDARQLSRRRLVEVGGKQEVAMVVPVVFLVLPVTVLFAVYPGLAVLRLAG